MFPLRDDIFRRHFPLVTWLIICVNVAIYYMETALGNDDMVQLMNRFAVIPARYGHDGSFLGLQLPIADYLPLLTGMFLHGSWLHIIGNMWFLHLFGASVEDRMGPVRYLFFYLLCGILAGLIFIYFDLQTTMPSIGASGAIAGVMGAYLVLFPAARIVTLIIIIIIPFFVDLPALLFIGIWFYLQVLLETVAASSPGTGGGIAWWAHIGGFVAGMLLIAPFRVIGLLHRPPYPDEKHRYIA
ncbi:MAG TPA: rhomboid family intramembrane serine protease [Syntrophales bacterium]|nr:rhomboid family intramembrane serine protease [Syntrophales bacterium]